MKPFALGTLLVIMLSSYQTSSLAKEVATEKTTSANIVKISPVNLVKAAYQGRFS